MSVKMFYILLYYLCHFVISTSKIFSQNLHTCWYKYKYFPSKNNYKYLIHIWNSFTIIVCKLLIFYKKKLFSKLFFKTYQKI